MSRIGDNDTAQIMWFDEAGNAVDAVGWADARSRLVAFIGTGTTTLGWAETHAEDLLCAMFTGRGEEA